MTARSIGAIYLLSALPGAFSIVYVPAAFLVAGDAAATAQRIVEGQFVYRVGILADLLSQILWIFLAVGLYGLLKDVNRRHATLMLASALVIVPIGFVDMLVQVPPLILLSGADFLSGFTKPQLESLAYSFVILRLNGLYIASAFWGLWLLPFGMLVIRSGFFPKVLGMLLILAGAAYLGSSFASIILPAQRQVVALAALPFYAVGELSMIVWLLVKGANVPVPEARAPTGLARGGA